LDLLQLFMHRLWRVSWRVHTATGGQEGPYRWGQEAKSWLSVHPWTCDRGRPLSMTIWPH